MKIINTGLEDYRSARPDRNNDAWTHDKNRDAIMDKLKASGLVSPKNGSTPYQDHRSNDTQLGSGSESSFEHILDEVYDGLESGLYAESEVGLRSGVHDEVKGDEGESKKTNYDHDEWQKTVVSGVSMNSESFDRNFKKLIIRALANLYTNKGNTSTINSPVVDENSPGGINHSTSLPRNVVDNESKSNTENSLERKAIKLGDKGLIQEQTHESMVQKSSKDRIKPSDSETEDDNDSNEKKEKTTLDQSIEASSENKDVELNIYSTVLSTTTHTERADSVEFKVGRAEEVGLLINQLVDRILISDQSIKDGGKIHLTLGEGILGGAEILLEKVGASIHLHITAQTMDSYRYLYRKRYQISAELEQRLGCPVVLEILNNEENP